MTDYELVPARAENYEKAERGFDEIRYIVVHYTANRNDTARGNCRYFQNTITKTSGHFFVDGKEIVQSVPLDHAAWHCGGKIIPGTDGGKFYGKCTNTNSISVELCGTGCTGTEILPSEATVEMAVALVKELMEVFGIPAENVIRHYDVTGKLCPAYWVDETRWNEEFKSKLVPPVYFNGIGISDGRVYLVADGIVKKVLADTNE